MPHVEVNHSKFLIGPYHRVITTMPDFIGFRACPQRKTGGVNRHKYCYVRVGSQIILPPIPFVRRGLESFWQIPSDGMICGINVQNRRCRAPGVAQILAGSQEFLMIPISILRKFRGRQGKCGKMKSHPGTAKLHVVFKGLSPRWIVWPGIQEDCHPILLQRFRV